MKTFLRSLNTREVRVFDIVEHFAPHDESGYSTLNPPFYLQARNHEKTLSDSYVMYKWLKKAIKYIFTREKVFLQPSLALSEAYLHFLFNGRGNMLNPVIPSIKEFYEKFKDTEIKDMSIFIEKLGDRDSEEFLTIKEALAKEQDYFIENFNIDLTDFKVVSKNYLVKCADGMIDIDGDRLRSLLDNEATFTKDVEITSKYLKYIIDSFKHNKWCLEESVRNKDKFKTYMPYLMNKAICKIERDPSMKHFFNGEEYPYSIETSHFQEVIETEEFKKVYSEVFQNLLSEYYLI